MFEVSGLSKKDIQEEYEDLVFRKVMAIYVENESKQILAEIKAEKENNNVPVDTKTIEKLYDKKERRENLSILWKYSKKVVSFAAMIVFVAIVSLSSAVVAFADVREAVVDAIYHLVYEENERYTQIEIGKTTGFVDSEIYVWENAYAPTYMPEKLTLESVQDLIIQQLITYSYENEFIIFTQAYDATTQLDTESAEVVEEIKIGNSSGILISEDGMTCVAWSIGNMYFQLYGNILPSEIIKIAESIKLVK